MKKCRVCGKELWNIHAKLCENTRCFVEYELEKIKKLEKITLYHDIITEKKKQRKIFHLIPSRPWTSSCIDNLKSNIDNSWSAEKTSSETKRTIDEIKYMQKVLTKVGYKNLKKVVLKIEKSGKKGNINKELEWLREVGILNFFDFQIKKTSAITREAIIK
ncbi:MAG: hypothetical protein ACQESP_04210 [Candidatus Muiribacteriota bacterium]